MWFFEFFSEFGEGGGCVALIFVPIVIVSLIAMGFMAGAIIGFLFLFFLMAFALLIAGIASALDDGEYTLRLFIGCAVSFISFIITCFFIE